MKRIRTKHRRTKKRRHVTRNAAAKEAISKTGNWQKILRERIEGLSWERISDPSSRRGLRPQLALSSGGGFSKSSSYSE
jgi:hypothetical protein